MTRSRRGSTYIVILMSVLIVTTIGIAGVALVRAQERDARTTAAAAEARLLANSAVEAGMQFIADNSDWRTRIGDGSAFLNRSLGHGTAGVTFIDPNDADITDDETDPIIVQGSAKVGGVPGTPAAQYTVQVTLTPDPRPLAILSSAVHAAGLAEAPSGKSLLLSGGTLSSNYAVKNSGRIDGSLLAPLIDGYGFVSGSKTVLNTAMTMPSGVAARYTALGVEIPYSSNLEEFVLSPGYSPWGETQPDGVYFVRASGGLTIRRCRVNGTLVVINPGNTTKIDKSVLFENARADYPVLIVDGDLIIETKNSDTLTEIDADTNLNPPGAPYADATDNDINDSYPNEIHGLVYATGTIQITDTAKIVGVIISGSTSTSSYAFQISENCSVVYDPAIAQNPPPGFTSGSSMRFVPSSWTQIVER